MGHRGFGCLRMNLMNKDRKRDHTPLFYGNTFPLAPLGSCVPQIVVDVGLGLDPFGGKKILLYKKKRVMSIQMAVVILIVQLRFIRCL